MGLDIKIYEGDFVKGTDKEVVNLIADYNFFKIFLPLLEADSWDYKVAIEFFWDLLSVNEDESFHYMFKYEVQNEIRHLFSTKYKKVIEHIEQNGENELNWLLTKIKNTEPINSSRHFTQLRKFAILKSETLYTDFDVNGKYIKFNLSDIKDIINYFKDKDMTKKHISLFENLLRENKEIIVYFSW